MATTTTTKKKAPVKKEGSVLLRNKIACELMKVTLKEDGCWEDTPENNKKVNNGNLRGLWSSLGSYCGNTENIGMAGFLHMADAVLKYTPPVIQEAMTAKMLLLGA